MDELRTGDDLSRRRAVLRALPTPVDVELYVADAPPLLEVMDDLPEPRIADLDALLREVDDLRSSIRRDLGLAATAAEAGADELAGWLLIQEDGAIRSFEERALAHLHDLEASETVEPAAVVPAPRRVRRMMPAAPLVAACAAVFGFLTIPAAPAPTSDPQTSNVALESYAELTRLATGGASDSRITAAAQQFHADLAPLVAAAGSNPAAAEKAIALLQSERAVIAAGADDSPALLAVLRQADALVAKLRASLPRRSVRVPVVVPQPQTETEQQPARRESARPKASSSPKPSASPSASPKPPASPQATTSPKPSPSPSESNPLPTSPLDE